ncbi:MAG TPA: glutamate 5-kinase [Phycisphaerales bacterium]|nr:glutamate 5-kinase [Phycisphaerales bacterium]
MTSRSQLVAARKVVIKLGSAVVAPEGTLSAERVAAIAADVRSVMQRGVQVIVVSSGAVASGFRALGLASKPKTIVQKQAAAAVGQQKLMRAWDDAFGATAVAQVLLTADDFDHRGRMLNAKRTLGELVSRGVVPIINENDSVSFDEIKLGDNDRLSALVAGLMQVDALIVLSSVDGLFDAWPNGKRIGVIEDVGKAMEHVSGVTSSVGTGGMRTKLEAAGVCAEAGIATVMTAGVHPHVVSRVLAGEDLGTFVASASKARVTRSRQRWIGYATRVRGTIVVDEGAKRAIVERGASLLAKGVRDVVGSFPANSPVEIAGADKVAFARGITPYDANEVRAIAGKASDEIEAVLGVCIAEEVIHRDDMAVVASKAKREQGGGA